MRLEKQLVIIGAGPAGIAAAIGAFKAGIRDIVVIEREKKAGGILNQCIHDGFGTIKYGQALTGPEYADRELNKAKDLGIDIMTNAMAIEMSPEKVVKVISPTGEIFVSAHSVIFATGCRERTRGNLMIPGSRPAGIFTAGVAQHLVNVLNIMPGKRIVILGSGDIGLIMARRLSLEGAEVIGVYEIQPKSGGLKRNIQQCLLDYNIPLFLNHTVTKINGTKRLQSVEISKVDENGSAIPGTEQLVECDTLILSVGLIPENEVLKTAYEKNYSYGAGITTDQFLQTFIPGVFLCGNSRKVLDLVDFVSEEGEFVGRNAAHYLKKELMETYTMSKRNEAPKGVPQKDERICIICPRGCNLQVMKQGEEIQVLGNNCPRGEEYAKQEINCPRRRVTTTIKTENGELLPVKTSDEIELRKIKDIVNQTKKITVNNGTHTVGDVLYSSGGVEFMFSGNSWS